MRYPGRSIRRARAAAGAMIGLMAAPLASAQTIPAENFTVQVGPNGTQFVHYADTLCGVRDAPWPASVQRTFHTDVGGRSIVDIYTVYKPQVRQAATIYGQIPLNGGDRLLLYACGCVQTGGKGLTWKSYFDPKGDESDRYYSGTFGLIYNGQAVPPDYSQHPTGLRRIKDVVTHQGPGLTIPAGRTARIVLGYQDDGYPDNGYSARNADDGTGDQCRGAGPAAVDVVVYHNGAH